MDELAWGHRSAEEYVIGETQLRINCGLIKVISTDERGENRIIVPSKLSRSLASIVNFTGHYFKGTQDEIKGFHHNFNDYKSNGQEIVLLKRDDFLNEVEKAGYDLIWFVHLFKSKKHSERIKDIPYVQRSRKYLVYFDDDRELRSYQFWNSSATNVNDQYPWETIIRQEPILRRYDELRIDQRLQVYNMIIACGDKEIRTLEDRLKSALMIAIFENKGEVLSMVAIKKPLPAYRKRAFQGTQDEAKEGEYDFELGYMYTLPIARGKKLSLKLIVGLLRQINGQKVFAATVMFETSVHRILRKSGFTYLEKSSWNGRESRISHLYVSQVDIALLPS